MKHEAQGTADLAKTPSKTRYCAWHETDHPITEFNAGQRYCAKAMTEYQRRRRARIRSQAKAKA